jgi:cytochrome c oxidase subunit 2
MGGFIPQASTFAASIDSLFVVVLVVTGIAFVLVEGILIYFLIRYRHRADQKAAYVHGNHRLELAWTVGTGLAFFSLALYQYNTWTQIKISLPDASNAAVIGISSNQFEWEPTYPGADGVLCTADDVHPPVNVLHFPVGRPVLIRLKSEDVIHSFFVPELRVKQDAVPGRQIEFWFEPTRPGQYEIACAELCGLGHYRMRAAVTVESQADLEAWLAQQTSAASEHDFCSVAPMTVASVP